MSKRKKFVNCTIKDNMRFILKVYPWTSEKNLYIKDIWQMFLPINLTTTSICLSILSIRTSTMKLRQSGTFFNSHNSSQNCMTSGREETPHWKRLAKSHEWIYSKCVCFLANCSAKDLREGNLLWTSIFLSIDNFLNSLYFLYIPNQIFPHLTLF